MMKNFFSLLFRLTGMVVALGVMLVGALTVFASFFFEETRAQMTWLIAAKHLAMFLGGMLAITFSVQILMWVTRNDPI